MRTQCRGKPTLPGKWSSWDYGEGTCGVSFHLVYKEQRQFLKWCNNNPHLYGSEDELNVNRERFQWLALTLGMVLRDVRLVEDEAEDSESPSYLRRSRLDPEEMKPVVLTLCDQIKEAIEKEHAALHSNDHGTRSQARKGSTVRPNKRKPGDDEVLPSLPANTTSKRSKKSKTSDEREEGTKRPTKEPKGKAPARRRK